MLDITSGWGMFLALFVKLVVCLGVAGIWGWYYSRAHTNIKRYMERKWYVVGAMGIFNALVLLIFAILTIIEIIKL